MRKIEKIPAVITIENIDIREYYEYQQAARIGVVFFHYNGLYPFCHRILSDYNVTQNYYLRHRVMPLIETYIKFNGLYEDYVQFKYWWSSIIRPPANTGKTHYKREGFIIEHKNHLDTGYVDENWRLDVTLTVDEKLLPEHLLNRYHDVLEIIERKKSKRRN